MIIIDLPGLHEPYIVHTLMSAAPNAFFLIPGPSDLRGTDGGLILEKKGDGLYFRKYPTKKVQIPSYEDPAIDDWRGKRATMMRAFSRSGTLFDPVDPILLDAIPASDPVMRRFLTSLPGYAAEKNAKGQPQDGKAREQYGLLTDLFL